MDVNVPKGVSMYIPYKLLAVAAVAGEEPTRYSINGVCIERDGKGHPIMIATDGHMLLSARWIETEPNLSLFASEHETIDGFTTVLPKKHALRMLKFINKKAARNEPSCGTVVLDEIKSGEKVFLETADGALSSRIESKPIDTPFPPWRDIVPKYKLLPAGDGREAIRIAVNPALLADLLKIMEKAAPSDHGVILTIPTKPSRPILIERIGEDGEKLLAILMPVNDDTLSNEQVACWNWDEKPTEEENESGGLGKQPPKTPSNR